MNLLTGSLPTRGEGIARYEAIQARLPQAKFPTYSVRRDHLGELLDDIDCFVLDGFGVLNIGDTPVPGAVARLQSLRSAGKHLRVLTNGATMPAGSTWEKYQRWQMAFESDEIISSRDALSVALADHQDLHWGFAAIRESQLETLAVSHQLLDDDPASYAACDGFVLLGTRDWNADRQSLLSDALKSRSRPLLVGNPDLVAPHPSGLSREPGLYAHDLWDKQLVEPSFYGKPFDNAFELVRATLPDIPVSRTAMVGDTLHTDILGGAQAGWKTVLVSDHGLLKDEDVQAAINRSGIVPDYIVPTI